MFIHVEIPDEVTEIELENFAYEFGKIQYYLKLLAISKRITSIPTWLQREIDHARNQFGNYIFKEVK